MSWCKILFVVLLFCGFGVYSQGQEVLPQMDKKNTSTSDQALDTTYVVYDNGIPWNRENFNTLRLLRPFEEGLSVSYSYTMSFVGGSFGSFGQQTFLAHLDYAFSPDLHLYANLGLWMPFYGNGPVAKEDAQLGRVGIVIPNIALEYKPSENTYLRLMLINERDAMRAYGGGGSYCNPYRNSIFCR